jgi:hypothetical protein
VRLAARGSGGVLLLPCHGAAGELLSFLWMMQITVDELCRAFVFVFQTSRFLLHELQQRTVLLDALLLYSWSVVLVPLGDVGFERLVPRLP